MLSIAKRTVGSGQPPLDCRPLRADACRMKLSVATVVLSLSLVGPASALELRDLDPKTPACKDFYQFANGGWLKATPVPAHRESFGTFDVLQERNRAQQQALLAEILQQPKDSLDGLIADFVTAGLDEAGLRRQV